MMSRADGAVRVTCVHGFGRRLLALLLACMAGIGSAAAVSDATLVRGIGPEPATLDPHRAQDLASFNVLFELYEGLVSETPDGRPAPGLAEHWQTSDDGLRWHFHLRPDLRFSDGTGLAADDVVAGFRRAVDPAIAAPYAGQLSAITGVVDAIAGRVSPAAIGVRALDAQTVEIELNTPMPHLSQLLMLPVAFPVHPALHAGARPEQAPGNGAFMLVDRVPQSHLRLARNPQYHGAAGVRLAGQRLVTTEDAHSELNRFRTGELHITETIPPGHYASLRREFGEQLRVAPYLGSHFLGYNLSRPPFAGNLALREALSLAVDREILVRHLTGAGEQPAFALVPPGMPDWPVDVSMAAGLSDEARVALARQRFADSGFDAKSLRVQIRYNSQPLQRRLALAVAAMWRQTLGVQAELHNEEWRVFSMNRRERRITEVFRGGWIADYADPMSFLELFRSDSPMNWSGYVDAEYDGLLDRAQASLVLADRTRLMVDAEQHLLRAQPILPLYFHVSRHLVSPRVRGWEAHPLDRHLGRYLELVP
jgi:oligopeptide transport system substrate-binding protein